MSVCRPLIEAATIDRFGFDVELLYVATARVCDLKEIPVRWDHAEGSKVNVVQRQFKMLNEVGLIRQQARRGVYDRRSRRCTTLRRKQTVSLAIGRTLTTKFSQLESNAN